MGLARRLAHGVPGGGWEFPAFWTVALLVQAGLGAGAFALDVNRPLGRPAPKAATAGLSAASPAPRSGAWGGGEAPAPNAVPPTFTPPRCFRQQVA